MDPIDAFYDHYNRGELDAVRGLFTEDAVLVNTVLGQTCHGASQILGFLEDYADIVEEPTALPAELVHGFRIRDGRIAWYAISFSLADAFRAAGRLD